MRYKVKTQDCHLIVRVKASWGEDIDEKALETFAGMSIQGFMKPKVIKKNTVEYSGPIGISLYDRLKNPLSKREFLFIMEQIVAAVQKFQSNGLSISKVDLDLNDVFINDVTKEIQFLYVPSFKKTQNPGVISFVESIIYSAKPEEEADAEFISRFIYFLKGQEVFDPEIIEQYIAREDPTVVAIIKKQSVGQSELMTHNPDNRYKHSDGKDTHKMLWQGGEETEAFSDNFAANNHRGIDRQDDLSGLLYEHPYDPDTAVLLNNRLDSELPDSFDDAENGTVLLKEIWAVHYPSLFRVWNRECISVDKPVFKIGKERGFVDYCVKNNNAVSRSHAKIVTRGNKYFVIDMNSKNHTYINEQIIAPQCETEIQDGDRLKLANEEFIFHI